MAHPEAETAKASKIGKAGSVPGPVANLVRRRE
jgi:hypothetical protein